MTGYLKLKTENKELYESNFLDELKMKNTKFSKLQYRICYLFYEFIVFIKYFGNIITVKQIYYAYIFIFPFNIKKVKNKYKLKICMKKLQKLMKKYKVNTLILSNELKEIVEFKDKNIQKAYLINENNLMQYLIKETLTYILEIQKSRTELEDLYICIKEFKTDYEENILYLSNYFKTINIITPNIANFKKLENKIEQNGILITINNNKSKSLKRAKLIVNFDFSKEEMQKYTIYRRAVIISIKESGTYNNLGFDGIQVRTVQIDTSNEIKNIFKKYNLLENYSLIDLYMSLINKNQTFSKIKLKMNQNDIKIIKLYGNNGEINNKEYLKIVS